MRSVPPHVIERRDKELAALLRGVGAPQPEPFAPDPFQLEAVEAIRERDVIVTAPTGTGKTWIAVEAIARCLEEGRRSWYTSPLKALSNSKYQELGRRFGFERVGIVTGDRQENLSAPILVATAEIYRNRLYDFLRGECEADHGLVVFDEAHYLADPDRGVTWEEALIFAPTSVRCLLLSATVSNATEVASWLTEIRGVETVVISREHRPVPLEVAMAYPRGERLGPFWARGGKRLHPDVVELDAMGRRSSGVRRSGPRHAVRAGELVTLLKRHDLVPALVFMGSRAACDGSVESFRYPDTPRVSPERSAKIRAVLEQLADEVPALAAHRHLEHVIAAGVAAHHAGHHPAWKLALERLMTEGLLDALFSTTTMAAGVDFPTRTACLTRSVTWDGRDERPLYAREVQQMTGRAGRRGKDRVGFAVAVPGPAMDVQELAHALQATSEPIESQFKPSYTMALNLLGPFRPREVEDLLRRSLGQYQVATTIEQAHVDADAYEARALSPLRDAVCDAPLETFRMDARIRRRGEREGGEGEATSPCPTCSHLETCVWAVPRALGAREKAARMRDQAGSLAGGLWRSFELHADVLLRYGYLDADLRPAADGAWAALLRLDAPLVLAEAIRRDIARPDESLVPLAASLGGSDRELVRDPHLPRDLRKLVGALGAVVNDVERVEHEVGISSEPSVNPSAAFVMHEIVAGRGWPEVECDEGDLVRLAWRTVDVLRQIGNLVDTHPELAREARTWMYRLREDPRLVFE